MVCFLRLASQDRHDGVVVAKLFIRKIKPDNFRKYTLVVENSIASATKVIELQQRKSHNRIYRGFRAQNPPK